MGNPSKEMMIRAQVLGKIKGLDERFKERWENLSDTYEMHVIKPVDGMTRPLHDELARIESGRFAEEDYAKFSMDAQDIMVRRATLMEDPQIALRWASQRITPNGIAVALGFDHYAVLRAWARRMDSEHSTQIEAAVLQIREVYADTLVNTTGDLLMGIGTLDNPQVPGDTLSLSQLAFDYNDAVIAEDDAAAFRLSQQMPILKAAVDMDTTRRTKIAEHWMKLAQAYAPRTYGNQRAVADVTPQHVMINMDFSQPRQDTASASPKDVTPAPPVKGITLDMRTVEDVEDIDI